MTPRNTVLALCCALALALIGWSQTTDAVVSGTVIDPDGAVVPSATVIAENVKTGVVTTVKTNNVGIYLFAALPPGIYRIKTEHEGFQVSIYDNLQVEVGAQLTVNISLKVGKTAESVVVQAYSEQLETTTSTVGTVITTQKLLDLPLVGRNAYDLISTQAGTSGAGGQNFNGLRAGALNLTLDGTIVRDNFIDDILYSSRAETVSVDRIAEFRIITSPADAEYGRGSGQIQAVSRGGTNQFHGSLFAEHRDTALTANDWFNNQLGVDPNTGQAVAPRNFLIRNQFGGRIGGPIRKNRTFFNFDYEGSRQESRNSVTSTVYTAQARQGIFRYFPGVRNGNALAAVPTVDRAGNPVTPPGAAGPLQSFSLFGRDPNRPAQDPSGIVAGLIKQMPLPNTYLVGDGLNTAGYTFQQKVPISSNGWDFRIDHNFSAAQRFNGSFGHQATDEVNVAGQPAWPGLPVGSTPYNSNIASAAFTSVFRSNLLNEFRAGMFRPRQTTNAAWGSDGQALPHTANNQPIVLQLATITSPYPYNLYGQTDQQDRISPIYQFGDTITWLKGRHSIKGGAEVHFVSYAGFDNYANPTRVALGNSAAVPINLNAAALPSLAANQALATAMLGELSGSVADYFTVLNSGGGPNPVYTPGLTRYRHIRQNEIAGFLKDDFRVNSRLTLNIGVRYERYSVPQEASGLGVGLVGGGGGMFGLSGTSMSSLFQPGNEPGQLTQLLPIGPKTPNPGVQWYNDNNHDFAPAVGLSWAVNNKTVMRSGYFISYIRNPLYLTESLVNGHGYSSTPVVIPGSLVTLTQTFLPFTSPTPPLAPVPLTDRSQPLYAFDGNLKDGYVQNWNFSIQRSLTQDMFLEARYVGNKGSRLVRSAQINEVNVFENGIADAFRVTQQGGNAPLFDKIFAGIGGVGSTISGSDYVRTNAALQAYLAQNNVGSFAQVVLNQGTPPTAGAKPGDYLRRAGLPENFITANPQFGPQAYFISNFGFSTYNALQIELNKRFSSGWILQANYTWSKAMGDEEADDAGLRTSFRTLRDRALDKRLLYYDRAHVFHINGIWELPLGPGKTLFRHAPGWAAKIVSGWQAGWIGTIQSGQPISITGVNAYNYSNDVGANTANIPFTPEVVGPVSGYIGGVQRTPNGVVYFAGLHQVLDPSIQQISSAAVRQQSTMLALANSAGQIVMQNAAVGQFGNLAPSYFFGPGLFRLDFNLLKRIKITESKEFILRADAVNLTNTPAFGVPDTNMNSPTFGRITSTLAGSDRVIVVGARLNF